MRRIMKLIRSIVICVISMILAFTGSFTLKAEDEQPESESMASELTQEAADPELTAEELPEPQNQTDSVNADRIIPDQSVYAVKIGETIQLKYTLEPSYADEKPVFRIVNGPPWIVLGEDGSVIGTEGGSANVRAEIANGDYAEYTIYVYQEPESISFDRTKYTGAAGVEKMIYISSGPSHDSEYCPKRIESSDPSVVTPRDEWVYRDYFYLDFLKAGTATITVTSLNGLVTTAEVNVVEGNLADSISSEETMIGLKPGESRQLSYVLSPEDADEKPSFYVSDDVEHCITVDDNGLVSAYGTGQATVNAELANGNYVTYKIYSADEPVSFSVGNSGSTKLIATGSRQNKHMEVSPRSARYCRKHVTSSNPDVIRIDDEWTYDTWVYYSAVSEGKATITIETDNGLRASFDMEAVDGLAEYVSVETSTLYMHTGDTYQTAYTLYPSDASEKPVFSVSEYGDDCISVDENGLITALQAGCAQLNIRLRNGSGTNINVYVSDGDPEEIRFDSEEYYVLAGSNISLDDRLLIAPYTSKYAKLTMEVSDESVAQKKYRDGPLFSLTGVRQGTTDIIVSAENGVQAKAKLNVIGGYASQIRATESTLWLEPGNTQKLGYNLQYYDNTDNEKITFVITSGEDVISVSEDGTVTALKPGQATVEARTALYYDRQLSYKSESYYVTVYKIYVGKQPGSLRFNQISYELKTNERTAAYIYADSSDSDFRNIIYSSSDPSVVSVSATGTTAEIKGISAGMAIITATAANGVSTSAEVTVSADLYQSDFCKSDLYAQRSFQVGETLDLSEHIFDGFDEKKDLSDLHIFTGNPEIISIEGTILKANRPGITSLWIFDQYGNMLWETDLQVYEQISRFEFVSPECTIGLRDNIALRSLLRTEPENTVIFGVEFSSSDPGIAYIGKEGTYCGVVGVKEGDTVITAVSESGETAQMTVHVTDNQDFSDLNLDEELPVIIYKNYTKSLSINGLSKRGLNSYSIDTSDSNIVRIGNNKSIIGVNCGTAIITATLNSDRTKKIEIPVTVIDGDPDTYAYNVKVRRLSNLNGGSEFIGEGDEITCYVGSQYQIDSDATWTFQYWMNELNNIMYYAPVIESGQECITEIPVACAYGSGPSAYGDAHSRFAFTALHPGTVKVRTIGNHIVTIQVVDPVVSLKIQTPKNAIDVNETIQLNTQIESETAVTAPVFWKSSDTSIVTVDQNGSITGIRTGTAVIKASTGSVSDSIEITVIGPLEAKLITDDEIYAGEATVLKAEAAGGSAPYRYQFTAKIDGKWIPLQNGTESECTYTFEKAGSYPVNVTVTDSTGTRVKSQKTLTVTVRPSEDPLAAEIQFAEDVYAGEATVLKAEATGGSAPYKYQFTAKIDGKWTTLHNGTESECTYTFKKGGSYPVNVTVTDNAGTRVKSQKTLRVLEP